jgi:hypothetical protein
MYESSEVRGWLKSVLFESFRWLLVQEHSNSILGVEINRKHDPQDSDDSGGTLIYECITL